MYKNFILFGLLCLNVILAFLLLNKSKIDIFPTKMAFVNIYPASGIIQNPVSAGVSWSDYDNDGYLDLLIVSSKGIKLYKNNRNDTFEDVTKISGLPVYGGFSAGVFGDYDNDGCPDLFLVGIDDQPDSLYHNNCDGTFNNVTISAKILKIRKGFRGGSVAWADYDNDGYLDLYVVNFGTFTKDNNYVFAPNILYHNNKDGTFTDVTQKSGITGITTCGLLPKKPARIKKILVGPLKLSFQPVWFDYNNDNYLDLFVATDNSVSPLYKNNGDGTFMDVTKIAGLCLYGSNMGVAVGDYNNDNNLDLYTTNGSANYLWQNNGNGTFVEKAIEAGVSDPFSVGWGSGFLDYNNDGYQDIFVVNGVAGGGRGVEEIGLFKFDKLYKNSGDGTFKEVGQQTGIIGDNSKEALAFGDFNNDGFTDMFVATDIRNSGYGENRLYKNQGNNNNWITIQLVGTKSNRDGVGSKIFVHSGKSVQMRQVVSGDSFFSQSSLWQTFGLGSANKIDTIEIKWPSGTIQLLKEIKVNQKIVVEENS